MKTYNYFLLLILISPTSAFSDILFQENFDNLPDWAAQGSGKIDVLPGDFDFGYSTERYSPAEIPGSLPPIFINGSDANQVFGGTGKALIATYESIHDSKSTVWISDGFITKYFAPSNEVYVSFKVRFQPGFNVEGASGLIKLFRMMSWDTNMIEGKLFGSKGRAGPVYFFGWGKNDYGLRQTHAFRCGAKEDNYYCKNPHIINAPRTLGNSSMSANFTTNVSSLGAQIPDLVNGGFLPSTGIVSHEQVYGDIWHTMAFYGKLNSAPGAQDGVLKFWLNGEPLVDMNGIPWIGTNGSMDAKWNAATFGGNGHYHWDESNTPFNPGKERWVAFDDIVIRNSLPAQISDPKPPGSITTH